MRRQQGIQHRLLLFVCVASFIYAPKAWAVKPIPPVRADFCELPLIDQQDYVHGFLDGIRLANIQNGSATVALIDLTQKILECIDKAKSAAVPVATN